MRLECAKKMTVRYLVNRKGGKNIEVYNINKTLIIKN